MKNISIVAGLLLLNTSVFANGHTAAALEHANAAVVNGQAGQTTILLEEAKTALKHTLAASKTAKSVPKNHLDAAVKELQKSNDLGNLGHIGSATSHAEAALKEIEIGNRYVGSAANGQKH